MATVVRMPSVAAGTAEAAIARWLVAPGDEVAAGTPVAEIETEKALVEYAAEEAGTVGRLVLAEGQAGQVGDPILVLVAAGEPESAIDAVLSRGASTSPPGPPPAAVTAVTPASLAGVNPPRIFASPLVRKIAREEGIDLTAIGGTGPGGRIVRRDLERLAAASAAPAPAPVPLAGGTGQRARAVTGEAPADAAPGSAPEGPGGGRLVPHTAMRRAIARRLSESKASVPHFYVATECLVDELLALRERVNAGAAARVSVNDFVLMAAAAAFADVPEANVTWAEDGLIARDNVDIAIAVATEGGLVTPVLRDVGGKRLLQVAREARDLAGRARSRRLLQRELEGGVLSVSNLGMYGTLEFSAIINPPQSAILAVGAARQQPVAADGVVTVATVMRCTLSVDHRAIDGALAARWLAAFTARMQDPLGAIA